MTDRELRSLFPLQIVRGALLRPDGVAAGLVIGGAPAWDLLALDARSQIGTEYHRLLLALSSPIDVYMVDQPPDLDGEIRVLRKRQGNVRHPLLADVLDEVAAYLTDLAQRSGSRAKQVVWAVTTQGAGGATAHGVQSFDLTALLQRGRAPRQVSASSLAQRSALVQAVEQARRLADSLALLGGTPPPRLMEAEEIARLVYQLADPVRAARYPLAGALLDRVRRVVITNERGLV